MPEPFERNWQILIWRHRRGYYTALTLRPPETLICWFRSNLPNRKIKLPPNVPVYCYIKQSCVTVAQKQFYECRELSLHAGLECIPKSMHVEISVLSHDAEM